MMKFVLTFITVVILSGHALAQQHFRVSIRLDSSLIGKKVRYQYDNGKRTILLSDSISKKKEVVFKGEFFSTFATLDIIYVNLDKTFYLSKYLIGNKPAEIDLFYKPNLDQLLLNKRLVNARAVYDASKNQTYRELVDYNRKENMEVYNFTQRNKSELRVNDSLQKVYMQMLRSVNHRTLNFLKNHASDYFSFWYFQHEIATSLGTSGQDTTLLREQLNYFQATFPKKFTNSFEGKEMLKTFKRELNPLKKGNDAPIFSFKTIDGKDLKLNDFKGKVVLLDFWATWCAPCMKEIPFIKSLTKKYSEDKLVVIGISVDKDYTKLKRTINELQMNWFQYFDKETDISKLYGVAAYPTYFLIDQQGKILYTSNDINNEESKLTETLDYILK